MACPSPSLLLPYPASVDLLGFLHRNCASTAKLKFLLPSSSSTPPAGFSQRDNAAQAPSPVCELGLERELPSESTADARLVSPPSSEHGEVTAKRTLCSEERRPCGEEGSRAEILSSSSEAGKLLVEDGSFECNGSPASDLASTVENPCRVDFTSNGSTENPSSCSEEAMRPHEARNLDYDRPPATSATPPGVVCDTQHANRVKWQVCHEEAARLLLKCSLNMDFFDFIDVDLFGSDSFFLGPALSALCFGGLLFVTCTVLWLDM